MKLDKNYSYIFVCPVTNEYVSESKHYYNCGICPSCGDKQSGFHGHSVKQSGKWNRPSFFERILGKKTEWVQKKECNCDQ